MNELSRLHALNSYQLLDTLPQKELDEITEIASIICGTPISLISLIDSERQWFKSKIGFDTCETPREYAFCNHTIQSSAHMTIVEDSFLDERFKDNPHATGAPFVRFYAGAPLVTSDGHALGSLCVIDNQPRTLTQEQQRALTLLSKRVMELFELRKANLESTRLFRSSNYTLFTLTEQSPDFIATLDCSLRITYVNKSHGTLGREKLLGMSVLEIIDPDYRQDFMSECLKLHQDAEKYDLDMKLLHHADLNHWVTCRITPLKEGSDSESSIMLVCTDITERKMNEDRRKSYIKSLEEMMFMISHRLRSPVSRIVGLAALLKSEDTPLEKKLQCISYMNQSALDVDAFTRELTDFIESSRMNSSNTEAKLDLD